MAEGNAYEDESELPQPQHKQQQGKGTKSASASPTKQFKIKERYNWSQAELNQLVQEGTIREDSTTLQHVALHPYWLSNPLQGVEEELEDFLGKWVPSLNGYLVAVKNIRMVKRKPSRHSQIGFMYQDQPWVHVDAGAKFYLYTPVVGQKVTGTIMKFGTKAVICVIFKCFSISVVPEREEELATWSLGDELPFEITFVQNRRKGPIIRAKSARTARPDKYTTSLDPLEEDWTAADTVGPDEDWTITDTAAPDEGDDFSSTSRAKQKKSQVIEFGDPEGSSKKKKKKHREKTEYEEPNDVSSLSSHQIGEGRGETEYLDEDTLRSSKRHKHKDKRRTSVDPTLQNEDYDQPSRKKKHKDKHAQVYSDQELKVSKHKKRMSDVIVSDVLETSDDSSVTKKKKKKHM